MLVFIFAISLFLSSYLSFSIQPLVAKWIVPYFGGVPMVWNATILFFQISLLLGYLYAQFFCQKFSRNIKLAAGLHCSLLLLVLWFSPMGPDARALTDVTLDSTTPLALKVLEALFVWVGPAFIMLCANPTLLQFWFSRTRHIKASNPYFLYIASNLGNLIGLLSYPFIIEPFFELADQYDYWITTGLLVCLLIYVCSIATKKRTSRSPATKFAWKPSWLLFAFGTNLYLMGTTIYLTTDVLSFPFFWVIPLGLYLFSYVISFSNRFTWLDTHLEALERSFYVLGLLSIFSVATQLQHAYWFSSLLHLGSFFLACVIYHRRLYQRRPQKGSLPYFYTALSLGGVLAGSFAVFLAPSLFQQIWEYPLAVAILILMGTRRIKRNHMETFKSFGIYVVGLGVLSILSLLVINFFDLTEQISIALLLLGIALILWMYRFIRYPSHLFVGAIWLFMVFELNLLSLKDSTIYRDRNFYGTIKIRDDKNENLRALIHGTTVHGMQKLPITNTPRPISYYHEQGPLGVVFDELSKRPSLQQLGLVGLGAGGLLAYNQDHYRWIIYELDPHVAEIAQNPAYFTYWQLIQSRNPRLQIGDARILLERAEPKAFDTLIIDAFSSDSIPTSLLTQEAFQLYADKLKDDGLIVFHLSNRFFDLTQLVAETAKQNQFEVSIGVAIGAQNLPDLTRSVWAFIFKNNSDWKQVFESKMQSDKNSAIRFWIKPEPKLQDIWTDQKSSLFSLWLWH